MKAVKDLDHANIIQFLEHEPLSATKSLNLFTVGWALLAQDSVGHPYFKLHNKIRLALTMELGFEPALDTNLRPEKIYVKTVFL